MTYQPSSRSASAAASSSSPVFTQSSSLESSMITTPTQSLLNGTNGKERAIDGEQPGSANTSDNVEDSAAKGNFGHSEQENTLLEHLYERGYQNGAYSDVSLHYRPERPPLKCHAIVLCLSPTLASLLPHPQAPQQASAIFLPLTGYEEITDEALYIAVGFLYSSRSLGLLNPSNAPAVLSAAILLQLPKLASYASTVCKDAIDSLVSPQEISSWVQLLQSVDGNGKAGQSYWSELKDALMSRLIVTLPHALHAFSTQHQAQQAETQTILQHVYSVLPFELLKTVLESVTLGAGEGDHLSDQTRFNLAKKIIAARKKMTLPGATPSDFEETVVLAFGGGSGTSNVNIVRKPRQGRKLWKASG